MDLLNYIELELAIVALCLGMMGGVMTFLLLLWVGCLFKEKIAEKERLDAADKIEEDEEVEKEKANDRQPPPTYHQDS